MRFIFIVLLQAIACCSLARADSYPDHKVTVVVPYAAGGGIDAVTRILAQRLHEKLGQPFIVENRLGAGGVIATTSVARAASDGYTLLVGSDAQLAIQVSLRKSLSYNPVTDFAPVAHVGSTPFALLTNPALPVSSVQDLIKLAKSKPGVLTYGSSGIGGSPHLVTEKFMNMTGTKMRQVPYKGTAPALNDVVAGHVDVLFAGLTGVEPLVREGKLRALGVSSRERITILPDVPTIEQAGVAGFEGLGFVMLVAPTGTPNDVVTKLHSALSTIVAGSDVAQLYERIGYVLPQPASPDELKGFIKRQIEHWGEVIDRAGLRHSQ